MVESLVGTGREFPHLNPKSAERRPDRERAGESGDMSVGGVTSQKKRNAKRAAFRLGYFRKMGRLGRRAPAEQHARCAEQTGAEEQKTAGLRCRSSCSGRTGCSVGCVIYGELCHVRFLGNGNRGKPRRPIDIETDITDRDAACLSQELRPCLWDSIGDSAKPGRNNV